MDGGSEGSCNRLEVVRDGETIRGARMPTMALKRGDRVKLVTGGGGGFGEPQSRPPRKSRPTFAAATSPPVRSRTVMAS